MVGRLKVGICGLGGRKLLCSGASRPDVPENCEFREVLGELFPNGNEKRGRENLPPNRWLLVSLGSIRMESFSEGTLGSGEEANGLSVRMTGMASANYGFIISCLLLIATCGGIEGLRG